MKQNVLAPRLAQMDDFAIASMLFDNNQEPVMDVIATAPQSRRFRAVARKTVEFGTFGYEQVSVRRFGGRFGGDVGNRKRRYHSTEHDIIVRAEKRAAMAAIIEGVAEYEAHRRPRRPVASTAESRAASGDEHRAPRQNTSSRTKVPEGFVQHGRTGVLVEVVVLTKRQLRKKSLAGTAIASRPRMTSDQVRASMGLAPKAALAVLTAGISPAMLEASIAASAPVEAVN